ncbi:hypothetical protein [Gelidibacter maritimus]|uniref:Uncharacterized protein n=1 Tax=Gelidibacter maritimus TaxID=2761487 RepID=A0A7W2M262_9FLAO|nr:hypothetical protein [Gelidibacter maritimus]MBA6151354.1 hypothetical protein [Gelidibacter maritimus]
MKHLIFTISLLALVSCKDNKNQETITHSEEVENRDDHLNEHHVEAAANVYDNSWTEEIEMDNGEKWQSDLPTNEGVKKLQHTINTQATSTLAEYHKLADLLNEDKNYVIKNCTMQGPAHDNLHVWLHPLIEKIAALTQTESVEDASKLKSAIDVNINAYYDYFK